MAACAGYSKKTAFAIGHENLTKPYIAAAIGEAIGERASTAVYKPNRHNAARLRTKDYIQARVASLPGTRLLLNVVVAAAIRAGIQREKRRQDRSQAGREK